MHHSLLLGAVYPTKYGHKFVFVSFVVVNAVTLSTVHCMIYLPIFPRADSRAKKNKGLTNIYITTTKHAKVYNQGFI